MVVSTYQPWLYAALSRHRTKSASKCPLISAAPAAYHRCHRRRPLTMVLFRVDEPERRFIIDAAGDDDS